ncbi:ornithine cyclodeaminase family protein [Sulfitobacter mediterraneus]|uniref:ornithine cyclodeaminase family protein n=1 Tax=Sulfitobacter mediterraneus TaxID=83219 RepID=UPI0021A8F374|nr:ornithine cyclodeaminase family protein [Sulfitobacter mediterraneus]UWR11709.1 ornithine cyclodeaminase family protein [Sulfitobacter mediterraneus]
MIPMFQPEDIAPHLDIAALLPAAKDAFRALSDGSAQAPVYVLHPNDMADIHVKSACLPDCPIFTVKMAGWSQVLVDRGEPASSGLIVVFDSITCKPIAILQDNHLISDYRTAAAGALVADLLAPRDVASALVVGTGMQARLQVEALLLSRRVPQIAVWGRDPQKTAQLRDDLAKIHPRTEFSLAGDLADAVPLADVILTATAAKDPVIDASWLRPGQHITSVGSDDATKCEIDPQTMAQTKVFVDARTSGEAFGSPRRAIAQGIIAASDLTEIGTCLTQGTAREPEDITLACLSGLGIQDLTAVRHLWQKLQPAAQLDLTGKAVT